LGISPIFLRLSDVLHTIGKLLTKATTLPKTPPQLDVCTQSYGLPKLQELQFWESRRVLGQNDIFVLAPWLGTENTIKGKVVVSPKSGLWWFLPSPGCGESCEFIFARGSFVHQKHSSYTLTNLLFGLCRSVWVINFLVNLPTPHPRTLARLSTLEVLWTKKRALTHFPFIVFTFGLVVESIKELGGVSSLVA